jgi:3',5'-cyclic AMP phosphodiesterase CpdA
MKLLLFSDLHCDAPAAQAIVDRADAFDVVVGAGDFSTCRLGIEKTIDVLRAITVPTVVVPGNGESLEELAKACRGWDSVQCCMARGRRSRAFRFSASAVACRSPRLARGATTLPSSRRPRY